MKISNKVNLGSIIDVAVDEDVLYRVFQLSTPELDTTHVSLPLEPSLVRLS
jgi:hypothetical protein